LEATDVVSVSREYGDGWSTNFVFRFGMEGLSENEGVFGVSFYLLGPAARRYTKKSSETTSGGSYRRRTERQ
jgi:hypothetical protein